MIGLSLTAGLAGIFALLAFLLWIRLRGFARREAVFTESLAANQKRLDLQTARITILARALPNLQKLVNDSRAQEGWRTLFMEEARSLTWAESAVFWRFIDKEGALEKEGNTDERSAPERVRLGEGDVGQAAAKRLPVIATDTDGENRLSLLSIPLEVSGALWGVLRLGRSTLFDSRDADLLRMFSHQLSLMLANRDLVAHRETFYLELVQALADVLDVRDAALRGQTRRVRSLARGIARELNMPEEFIYFLEFAALMHDVGKIAVDDQILRKPGKLSAEEFEQVKKHPEVGYDILRRVSMLAPVAPMVLYHQEWYDGHGYPEGLSGEEIPLGARIVAVLDAWSAMTSPRPWRKALTTEESVKEIMKGSGTQFDPKVVQAFLTVVERQGMAVEPE